MPYRCILLGLTLLIGSDVLASAAQITLRGEELQRRLLDDADDRQLDDFDLVSAALVASGVADDAQLDACRQQLDECFDGRLPQAGTAQERSAACLELLHTAVLTGRYHVEYTDLPRVLEEGHYNCVTATVLYCYLCELAGLEPIVVATREHVFVRFNGAPGWEVETTCAEWFQRSGATPSQVGANSAERRDVDYAQLLGKIFYNRAVRQLGDDQFREAIELLQISRQLDPHDQPAAENLLAAINNWSLAACRDENFAQAAELLAWGRELDPDYAPFATNDLHIHQKWTVALCYEQRFAAAIELLEAGYARRPNAPVFDEGRLAVYRLWTEARLIEAADAPEAWRMVEQTRDALAGDPRWDEYQAIAVENAAKRLAAAGRFEAARLLRQRNAVITPTPVSIDSN